MQSCSWVLLSSQSSELGARATAKYFNENSKSHTDRYRTSVVGCFRKFGMVNEEATMRIDPKKLRPEKRP